MKILLLGAGGTGGYFGGRLQQGGADVTFLVREKRAAQLARDGLILESPRDRVVLPAKTVSAATVKPDYDVVILSCKAFDLASSIEAIRPAMGPETRIVPLLNGITHLASLDAAFGPARVMGGLCQIAATLTKDGVVKSMADLHTIIFGAREPSQVAVAKALGEAFAKTVVDAKVSEDILHDMWEKVVFLSALAGLTCLMRGTVGDLLAAPGGREFANRFLDANLEIARREGFPPRAPVIERYQKVFNVEGSALTASMLRDLESGNQVEADHIIGFMLDKARAHGLDDTPLSIAYTHLKTYEARRAREALPK